MSTLTPPYSESEVCSKCGGSDIADRFHRAATGESRWGYDCWLSEPCWGEESEHILRHCRRCSFEWFVGLYRKARIEEFETERTA